MTDEWFMTLLIDEYGRPSRLWSDLDNRAELVLTYGYAETGRILYLSTSDETHFFIPERRAK